ncbi:MAG: kynurenine 3-monooxygenase [Candidatus Marinimicrobia bacterium]|nr:kynurenine 3-monooxygenase [Candidatus Neomarinimicrobiota bacterium]
MIKKATIVGSGLAGTLLSIMLAKKYGINTTIYERNSDVRTDPSYSGRSINLAISERGINALKKAGIYDSNFEKLLIPMYGRMIHDMNGQQSFQPYGINKGQFINSVSRSEINKLLLDKAESTSKVSINFSMKCNDINLEENYLSINNQKKAFEGPVFGADGYRSIIAKKVAEDIFYNDIKHGYKELTIKSIDNDFQIDPNALHIWPRQDMMLIALPNSDKTFTCTLFMRKTGKNSFEELKTKKEIFDFFNKNFTDVINLIPNLDEYFINNPIGNLVSIDVKNWFYKNKACLIGDSAHAVVPFYGQGMNASFEDCAKICDIIDENKSWESIFSIFNNERKKDADALSELALKNYDVMKEHVLDEEYLKKYNLSLELYNTFPEYFIPEYVMVSFTNTPYSIVVKRSIIQDTILNKILSYKKIPEREILEKIVKERLIKLDDEKNS